jgi:integrase
MTAILPTPAYADTPGRDTPYPPSDEYLPTGRTPLADYLTFFWLPRRLPAWAEGTRRYRTWTVNTLLESSLAPRAVEDLGVLEIERYFAHRAITPWETTGELPKAGSLKGLHDTLRASLNDAKKYGFIRDNPCTGVELPRAETTQAKIWTPEQVQSFLESTRRSRYVTLWRLLFATGLRRGEALGLQWADVDWSGPRLTVRRNLQADSREGNVRYGPPKSRRSTRTITIDPGTAEELVRWHRMRQTEHSAWLADLEKRLNGYRTPGARLPELPRELPDDSPIFANADGTPMLPSTVSDTFRRQVAKSGLPVMRLHDARHTHLTHLLRSGEPIQNVSARAGHGSSFTTLTTYAHVIAGDDERTAARAAGLFGD